MFRQGICEASKSEEFRFRMREGSRPLCCFLEQRTVL